MIPKFRHIKSSPLLVKVTPFFRNILRRNPHQCPLLYLKSPWRTRLYADEFYDYGMAKAVE